MDYTDRAEKLVALAAAAQERTAQGYLIEAGWGATDKAPRRGNNFLHVPARGGLRIVINVEQPVTYYGHYIRGAMRPHTGDLCLHCANHGGATRLGVQHRVVFGVWAPEQRIEGILELDAELAGATIRTAAADAGILRGLAFDLQKYRQRERGRIDATLLHTINPATLPTPLDIRQILLDMWAAQAAPEAAQREV